MAYVMPTGYIPGDPVRLWVDDDPVRKVPEGYIWLKSVNETIEAIKHFGRCGVEIAILDIDHDAGSYACDGGDYIKILDWLEWVKISIPIRIHSMNPVGVANMRRIIEKNGWKEIR
jgi:hypothetical protein